MLESEIKELVRFVQQAKCETNFLEVKSAENGCPKVIDTLSAFSNQPGGGKLLFGINEKDNYNICGVYDPADLEKKLMEQCLQMEPAVRPLCTATIIDGKIVVCAEIQEIDNFQKPCFYKGVGRIKGSYIRTCDGDRHMTEYEVYSYEAFKQKIHDELRYIDRTTIEDIHTNDYEAYILSLKKKKPNLSSLPEEQIARLQGFTDKDKPTLTGILLFALYPQAFVPQLCITAVSIPGTEIGMTGTSGERFIDNKRIEGTLEQILDSALQFVRQNIKIKTIINKKTGKREDKPEYPVVAIRELLLNALIHRDYSIHTDSTPITVRIYTDRLEIENPGGLYGRMTIDQLGKVSADTRNPFIANAMEVMGLTENRYSGIPTIRAAMREAGLPEPKFESDYGVFRATLYNDSNENKPFELPMLTLKQKEAIDFCKTPRSRAEIEEFFKGRATINYVMSDVIKPLVANGTIKLTIPDKPKSKNQRYYS